MSINPIVRRERASRLSRSKNSGEDDDEKQDNDANADADAHLDILPPHLLADPVGSAAEPLGRDGKVVGLVLKGIEVLATLRHLLDVLTHDTDGVIDLSLKRLRPGVPIIHLRRPVVIHARRPRGRVVELVLGHGGGLAVVGLRGKVGGVAA
jgi:hypothetical protein